MTTVKYLVMSPQLAKAIEVWKAARAVYEQDDMMRLEAFLAEKRIKVFKAKLAERAKETVQ